MTPPADLAALRVLLGAVEAVLEQEGPHVTRRVAALRDAYPAALAALEQLETEGHHAGAHRDCPPSIDSQFLADAVSRGVDVVAAIRDHHQLKARVARLEEELADLTNDYDVVLARYLTHDEAMLTEERARKLDAYAEEVRREERCLAILSAMMTAAMVHDLATSLAANPDVAAGVRLACDEITERLAQDNPDAAAAIRNRT